MLIARLRLHRFAIAAFLLTALGTAHAGCRIAGAGEMVDGAVNRSPNLPAILAPFPRQTTLYTYKDASGSQRYHDANLLNQAGAFLLPPVTSSPLNVLDCAGLTELVGKRVYVVWEPPAGHEPFTAPDGSPGAIRVPIAHGVAMAFWFSGRVTPVTGGVQLGNQGTLNVSATGTNTITMTNVRMHFALMATGAPFQPGVVFPELRSVGRLKFVALPNDPAITTAPHHTTDLIVRSGERSILPEGALAPFEMRTKLSTCNLINRTGGFIVAPVTSVGLAAVSAQQLSFPGAASPMDQAQVDWFFRCDALLDRRPRIRFDATIAAADDIGVALPTATAVVGVQLLDSRGVPIALGTPSQPLGWIPDAQFRYDGLSICAETMAQCHEGSAHWVKSPGGAAGSGIGSLGDLFPLRFRYFRRSDTADPVVPGPIQVRFTVTLDTP